MKKTYTDPDTDFNYFFNQEKLIESYKKYISTHKITKKELNKKLSKLLHLSEESIRKHLSNKNSPSLIEQIYEYGDILESDRYSFLELRETEESFYEKAQDILSQSDFVERCIQAVRSGVINILAEYAATDCFNRKKAINSDIVRYYRKKVDALEIMVMQIHKNEEVVKALFGITTIIKKFVCAGEYPGIIKEWYEINPKLRFYSPAFDLMIANPESFEIAFMNDMLDYHPTEEDKNEYLEYFAKLKKDNEENNYHYNLNDWFQKELISTVDVLFRKIYIEKTKI